jgi:hypothetical protein
MTADFGLLCVLDVLLNYMTTFPPLCMIAEIWAYIIEHIAESMDVNRIIGLSQ